MLDLTPRLADPVVRGLLALAIGSPNGAKVDEVCKRYLQEPERVLLGYEVGRVLPGCVGIEVVAEADVRIQHISVTPARQRRGIGRGMLMEVRSLYPSAQLVAETDGDAVGFYRRCGFEVESLGELYKGVERFLCTWNPAEN